MSTRELVFQYKSSGARQAAAADRRVRESVQKTGRVANREAGAVERWMERNKRAVQVVAAASLAAVGAILSASPTMRAQLSGVRAAFTLFADQIVRDLLPAGTNLGSMALELAQKFRDLAGPIRTAIGIVGAIGAAIAVLLPVLSVLISSFGTVAAAIAPLISALSGAIAAIQTAISVIALIAGVSATTVAAIGVLIAVVVALAAALILNIGGARDKVVSILSALASRATLIMVGLSSALIGIVSGLSTRARTIVQSMAEGIRSAIEWLVSAVISLFTGLGSRTLTLFVALRNGVTAVVSRLRDVLLSITLSIYSGVTSNFRSLRSGVVGIVSALFDRVTGLFSRLRAGISSRLRSVRNRSWEIFGMVRDGAIRRMTRLKNRVLQLLDIGTDLLAQGRDWVSSMASGIRDRASQLASAFRSVASDAAGAFVSRFNSIIPSSVSIPSTRISIPSILGGGSIGIGGGSLSIPQLETGGWIAADGIAMLDAGERVLPSAQVTDRGEADLAGSGETTIERVMINVVGRDDPQRTGRDIGREFEKALESRGA